MVFSRISRLAPSPYFRCLKHQYHRQISWFVTTGNRSPTHFITPVFRGCQSRPLSTNNIDFAHKLPTAKLGTRHESLPSFLEATEQGQNKNEPPVVELSTLIILTNSRRREILLGKKLRGFGTGKYNGFGGRLESKEVDPTPAHGARRELIEEANISVPTDAFSEVGTLTFTFRDREDKMVAHLFYLDVQFQEDAHVVDDCGGDTILRNDGMTATGVIINPNTIRGCDEMAPRWFSWSEIPLHQMFADDSVWLTHFLSERANDRSDETKMDGWFHFAPGGDDGDNIEHYFLDTHNCAQSNNLK